MVCSPGVMQACYDGPAGTEDAGACHAGMQTCAMNGTWGNCAGEVTPQPRTCANMPGVSCDGIDCVLWSIGFAGGGVGPIAATLDGGVVVAAHLAAAMSLGKVMVPIGDVTAKLNPDGTAAWATPVAALALTTDPSGNVYGAGITGAAISIGMSAIPPSQYVYKLDALGNVVWARSIAGLAANGSLSTYGGPTAIAAAPNGDIILGGVYAKTSIDLGDGPIALVSGNPTAYVARLKPDGSGTMASTGSYWTLTFPAVKHGYAWIGPFVGVGGMNATSVVFNVGLSPTVGGATLTQGNIGVALISATGSLQGAHDYGDTKGQTVLSANVSQDNTLIFTGSYLGTLKAGPTQTLTAVSMAPTLINSTSIYGDGFVVAMNQFSQNVRLAVGFGTAGHATGALVDSQGGIILGGTFTGTASLGAGPLNAAQGTAVLLAKFKPDGSPDWSRAFSHPQEDALWPYLAVSPDASSWLGGYTGIWPLDFGAGPINTMANPSAGFLAHFAP
jgi:hypothetical protein